jgi:ATP-dependent exoDNAse (exonuclease V) beta subunit
MAAREALLAVQLPCTNAGAVMKKWSDAHSDILEYAREGNWRAFIERGPVKRVIEGDLQFLGKPIPAEFVAALDPFLRQAAHVLLGETVRQNAATARFMGDFETILAELRSEEGGLRFEDLPRALAPAPAFGGPADDPLGDRNISIWFRLDGRIDHLLLDEFQDTSPLQWRVLRRLAEEILATGETGPHARSFFCVGDVKQSIYGWREAEPRLLADLGGDDGQFPILDPENLDISYRSAPLVLDTVNCVFESLSGCPALKEGPRATAAAAWDEVYEEHTAAKEHLPGSACLIQATPSKDLAEETAAVLELAVERVAAMVAEQPTATIAILLRRRMNIAPLIHRLAARGIRASDQGGNPLTDSEAVVQLLSLLHLADHPGDSIAAFHVATCPLGGAVGLTPENFREEAGTVAAHVRARLVSEGLGGFVLSFAQTVTSHYGHWDRRRFGQLVDLAHAYAPRAGLRPTSFVEHVRDTNVEDTTASNVKVMTIHGAKGLEFDAVVLPELDENFILHQPQLLSHRPHTFGPIETATCSPNRLICRLDEDLAAIRKERETREIRESLCLLYVAMTRAIHRLEMIVRGKGSERKNTQGRWSSILCHALGSEPDEDGFLWSHGDNVTAWCEVGKATGDAPSEPPPPFRLAPTTGPRSLPRRAPSTAEGGPVRRAADLIAPASSAAMEMGTLVHRLMEEVEWLEDFDAGDGDLLALLEPLCPEAPTREAARTLFREALAYDAISSALSRGARDLPDGRSARVENERAFAVLLEENGAPYLLTGFIDRLVVTYDGETPIAAEVIDHKTDHIDSPETLAERTEHYRPQLEAYRGAVARMTGLAETAITCRLLFLRTGEASEL